MEWNSLSEQKFASLKVFRYRPEHSTEPSYATYKVPCKTDSMVLDLLNYIKDRVDGSLTFRWSCRMGVCGSCGALVNGVPRLTCAIYVSEFAGKEIVIEPLTHFPVIKDLVVDIGDFTEKLRQVKPFLLRDDTKTLDTGEYRQTPEELESYRQASMCINCMLCMQACPIYGVDKSFLGPATLALGFRYVMDSRDRGTDERLSILASGDGVLKCTFDGDCSRVCPKHVDPAFTIQRLKIMGATGMKSLPGMQVRKKGEKSE